MWNEWNISYVRCDSFICVTWLIHVWGGVTNHIQKDGLEGVERHVIRVKGARHLRGWVTTYIKKRRVRYHLQRSRDSPWSKSHLHCNTLQHTATHCDTLQHTATHCNTLQHTATHCNTLQHIATHCNTLQPKYQRVTFRETQTRQAVHVCKLFVGVYVKLFVRVYVKLFVCILMTDVIVYVNVWHYICLYICISSYLFVNVWHYLGRILCMYVCLFNCVCKYMTLPKSIYLYVKLFACKCVTLPWSSSLCVCTSICLGVKVSAPSITWHDICQFFCIYRHDITYFKWFVCVKVCVPCQYTSQLICMFNYDTNYLYWDWLHHIFQVICT